VYSDKFKKQGDEDMSTRRILIFALVSLLLLSSLSFAQQTLNNKTNTNDVIERYKITYEKLVNQIMNDQTLSSKEKNEKIDFIQEKYLKSRLKTPEKTRDMAETKKLIDKAYEKRMKLERAKERKVGKLIDKYYKTNKYETLAVSVEKADKIEVMYKILDLLKENIIDKKDVNLLKYYVKKFAPYAGDTYLEEESKSLVLETMMATSDTSVSYDRIVARDYANEHWDSFNTSEYPYLGDMGGDCANFVSQCLHAGGFPMDTNGGWYLTAKDVEHVIKYPRDIDDFNSSWETGDPSPWISAEEFNNYWDSKSYDNKEYTPSDLLNDLPNVYDKAWSGDVIQILKQNLWWYEGYHTMIITSYASGNDLLMTYHSNEEHNKSLKTIIDAYNDNDHKFEVFYIKNGF